MRIFASICGILQMQRAQCGFRSCTWKRDGFFLPCIQPGLVNIIHTSKTTVSYKMIQWTDYPSPYTIPKWQCALGTTASWPVICTSAAQILTSGCSDGSGSIRCQTFHIILLPGPFHLYIVFSNRDECFYKVPYVYLAYSLHCSLVDCRV